MARISWNRLNKKWMALYLTVVLVPVSLLVAFRLTVSEPSAPQTITKETVSCEWDRPSKTVTLFRNEGLRSVFQTDVALVEVDVHRCQYQECLGASPFNGRDGLSFHTRVNASTIQGSIHSLTATFEPMSVSSFIIVNDNDFAWPAKYNTTITSMKLWGNSTSPAHVEAKCTGSPCCLDIQTFWIFKDAELEHHQLNVNLKVNYYNGTDNLEVNMPIQLNITPDISEDFDTAKEVGEGEYRGCLDTVDCADMYMVDVPEAQTLNVTMIPQEDADFNLYLYNSAHEQVASSENSGNSTESITYYADTSGSWYINITNQLRAGHNSDGSYRLNIQMTGD